MQPKKDSTFYRLPTPERSLYLTGMPVEFIKPAKQEIVFKNEKINTKLLKASDQKRTQQQFLESPVNFQHIAGFCSYPSDREAMICVSDILRSQHTRGFKSFEFISPYEWWPKQSELTKDLYILTGISEKDEKIVHEVRRWARAPLGCGIWIVLTSAAPYSWFMDQLHVQPGFLFSVKSAAISLG